MEKSVKIRKLLQDISKILETEKRHSIYEVLTSIVMDMEDTYNIQDDEIIEQLEMILKSKGVK